MLVDIFRIFCQKKLKKFEKKKFYKKKLTKKKQFYVGED